jgi:hypothetical protein
MEPGMREGVWSIEADNPHDLSGRPTIQVT